MKVLIVEDSLPMLKMLRQTISSLSDEISDCDDGKTALAMYSQQRPDWVLMDIELRIGDGIEATRQITHSFPGAKIVIVTNHDDDDLREAANSAGGCGYFLKDNLLALSEFLSVQPQA